MAKDKKAKGDDKKAKLVSARMFLAVLANIFLTGTGVGREEGKASQ